MSPAQAFAEMERDSICDFCINTASQIARFAGRHDADPRSRELREIADRLGKLATRVETAA